MNNKILIPHFQLKLERIVFYIFWISKHIEKIEKMLPVPTGKILSVVWKQILPVYWWFCLNFSKFYQAFTNVRKFFLNAIIHRNKLTKYILRFSNPAFKHKIEIATVLKKELSIVLSYLGNASN